VKSGLSGLNGLSPFLPAYNLNYTQVGPFYTGSGPGLSGPNTSSSDSSSDQSQGMVSPPSDELLAAWAMDAAWLAAA
jgi:hypothetical protein